MNIVIISGGTLETEYASALLSSKEKIKVIAVDGGLLFCKEHQIIPDYIVGDFDTIDKTILEEFRKNDSIKIREYNPCKDVTDTQAAVSLAIELLKKEKQGENFHTKIRLADIYLLGGLGTRNDHSLANIGCLLEVLKSGFFMKIIDKNNCIYAYEHDFEVKKEELFYQNYISFIAVERVEGLCIRGMKYDVEDIELSILSGHGVSNELLGEKAEIKFSSGKILVIEARD